MTTIIDDIFSTHSHINSLGSYQNCLGIRQVKGRLHGSQEAGWYDALVDEILKPITLVDAT